jgi:hypothetical protein
MSLAKRLLNNPGLQALCVPEEMLEVTAALSGPRIVSAGPSIGTVKLKRTFDQGWPNGDVVKYWRIVGPIGHPNLNSDLSVEGLREWGIIK